MTHDGQRDGAPGDARARKRRADYVIVYFKRGAHVSSSPWSGDLEAGKRVAHEGLIRRAADGFQIRAATLDGPLVWQDLPGPDGGLRGSATPPHG